MKRPVDDEADAPRNTTGKALFVRDAHGELVTVLPGQVMPEKAKAASEDAVATVAKAEERREAERLAARSAEDVQYDAYLNGRDAKKGNVWIQGAGIASADRAAAADSISAQMASSKEYAPSRAHDRSAKMKKSSSAGASSSGGAYGGSISVAAARVGAEKAAAALARAREASDDDDEDDELNASAVSLVERSMAVYNLPVSNLAQLDPYGNDLRVPVLERKTRKFAECFAESAAVRTLDGKPVLVDFEAIRKRYSTVFRESGSGLRGTVFKRFVFVEGDGGGGAAPAAVKDEAEEEEAEEEEAEEDDDEGEEDEDEDAYGSSFCLTFERHVSLVTPRGALDGSLGLTPARTQDLAVLYRASGGELTGMWIAPDTAGLGADVDAGQRAIETTPLFRAVRRLVAKLSAHCCRAWSYELCAAP